MKPRLLLLCPTKTYRAEAFVRAAQKLPAELSIASEEPSALSHLHPVSLPAFDFADTNAAVDFVREFAKENPLESVVAVDDQATLAAAAISESLGLDGNPPDAVYAASNKYRMRERMRAAGVPVPAFHLFAVSEDPAKLAGGLRFPVVLKPLMMAASRGVLRSNNAQEFIDAFRRVTGVVARGDTTADVEASSNVLVESYVPGWEVAVEGLLTDGEMETLAIFDKPDPLEGPVFPETIYVTPSRLDESTRRRVIDMTQRTVDALGLRHGPVHAEIRGDDNSVTLIEIAARSIGGLCSKVLHFAGGITLEDLILRHSMGMLATIPALDVPASGVMMMQAPALGRFREAIGVDEAQEVDGVDEVIISVHEGRNLEPLPEGFLYLGFIFARGDTPAVVERSLRDAFAKIEIRMD